MTTTESKPVIEIRAAAKKVPARPGSGPRARRRSRSPGLVKIFRRTHMYFGLVLVPFVLLYGLTAIFFNHPTWLDGRADPVENDPAVLEAHSGFPIDVLSEEIRASLETAMGESVEVVGEPAITGTFLFESRQDGERIRVRVDPDTLASTTQVTALPGEDEPRRFPEELETSIGDRVDSLKTEVESLAGVESPSIRVAPDIDLQVRVGDEEWHVGYDLRTGRLSERRVGELRRDFSLRSFLLRLHVSRGYPEDVGVRSFWGGIVDVTAFLMIFWAISGVVMWWQMRPLRNAGMMALGGGVLMAGLLAWGMYVALYL
ncbi:MAG: hypothetical protein CMJ34_14380 [Phycisphaerae bacterium]|nr:hypothetical protein [Phycisphaerae bacterium]